MVTQVSQTHRRVLSAQGYGIEFVGFEDHMVPMYAHRAVSDKKVGDVAFKTRVGNLKQLDDAEASYMARKAAQGFFPWKPGAECLKRTFENAQYVPDKLGGTRVIRSEPYMGCEWCRKVATAPELTQGPQGVVDEAQAGSKPPVSEAVTPPASVPAQAEGLKCGQCDFTTTKGEASLMAHFSHKHSGTRRARTRKGAGRRN